MTLIDQISEDIKKAMKSGDGTAVSVLRMVKSSIKNREIEKGDLPGDDEVRAILASFVKRSKESVEQFTKAERFDLVEKEKAEQSVVLQYLPRQLGEDQIRDIVREAISETGSSSPGDMGKVMKTVMAKLKGKADGKLVNRLVKEMLEV